MTALSADANRKSRVAGIRSYPVAASTQIYKGALVAIDSDGFLIPGANTAGIQIVGVADENVDNNPGSDGDKDCRVISDRAFLFTASDITQAMLGDMMFCVDDNTIDDAASNSIPVGRLVEFVSATSGWVFIPDGGMPVPTAVTGDTSDYVEGVVTSILGALAANGIVDDNTTT